MKHIVGKSIVIATLLALPSAAFASSVATPASPMADAKPKPKAKAKPKAKDTKKKDHAPAPSK